MAKSAAAHYSTTTQIIVGVANAEFWALMGGMGMLKVASLTLALLAVSPANAASTLANVDTDKDGTIDLVEAKAAASATFDKLDADHDGSLDQKELAGRISKKDWPTANPDKISTVAKDKYLALVEAYFMIADKDGEGTLDRRELRSAAGRKLERLLK